MALMNLSLMKSLGRQGKPAELLELAEGMSLPPCSARESLEQIVPHQRDTGHEIAYAIQGDPPHKDNDNDQEEDQERGGRSAGDIAQKQRYEDKCH
ncbi:MAG TPA: hypothetical protein VFO07_20610 [Roseiflexaceae bacterium]|nr:hypothetical protein [Roseiflexaceae bacterium]